jgi:hypothetical protein
MKLKKNPWKKLTKTRNLKWKYKIHIYIANQPKGKINQKAKRKFNQLIEKIDPNLKAQKPKKNGKS